MKLFPRLNKNGYYIIEDIMDPMKFIEYFKSLYMCVTNCVNSNIKRDPMYSFATKIESIEIRHSLVIIKKS